MSDEKIRGLHFSFKTNERLIVIVYIFNSKMKIVYEIRDVLIFIFKRSNLQRSGQR